jgi:DICT domain-containing protein
MAYISDTSSKGIESRDTAANKWHTRVQHSNNTNAMVCLCDTGNSQAPIAQSSICVDVTRHIIGGWKAI